MPYIVQADLSEKVSTAELIQLTDDAKLGVVDTTVVAKLIASAEAEIDGYLATRYAVPLAAPVPTLVKKWAVDLTVYNLYLRRRRVTEDAQRAYDDAIKQLRDTAKGLLTLGLDPPPARSALSSQGAVLSNESAWSRDKLDDF